jgi:RHS repeat-associated protein
VRVHSASPTRYQSVLSAAPFLLSPTCPLGCSRSARKLWVMVSAEKGFGPAETVYKVTDEEQGPALVFADATQSIYLADMTGDGLADLVRIRNGEVCYWPNLGYGRFGAKVTTDNPPHFDYPEYFDQNRIRLADIDGSGITDIMYLGRDAVSLWFNQSGNSWSDPYRLTNFPAVDNLSSVTVIDLLGNGTACLVWSSPLLGNALQPMRYIDLMSGKKPHVLQSVHNNMGAETRLEYAPSTRFYLQDHAAGRPWITKLPFPVHVVERVEARDEVSKTKLVALYRYHHGYFDGEEREFRGFGLVEQWDTESFAQFAGAGLFTAPAEEVDEELHLPPVYTKTWFHTGAYQEGQSISRHFEKEYYAGDPQAALLPDTTLPPELTSKEEQEACRALKGHMLRQEIYALDDVPERAHPYSVSESAYKLKRLQPRKESQHAVFYSYQCEALNYHYERHPDDPRLSHALTLEVDEFGNVVKSAAIVYPRRVPAFPEQEKTLITYAEADFINRSDAEDFYRISLPHETRTYELTGVPTVGNALFTVSDMLDASNDAEEIPYEAEPTPGLRQKRLIERVQTLYRKNDLSGPLPLGEAESLALPFESYSMVFTPGLLDKVYSDRITDDLLLNEGRYLFQDDVWWMRSGQVFYDPNADVTNPATTAAQELTEARQHFFLPRKFSDPFGHSSTVDYQHDLLIVRTKDAVDNTVHAVNDYRVLQPRLITDPNGNRSEVAFDTLGMVVGTAVMGKTTESLGDSLTSFAPDVTRQQIDDFFNAADPHAFAEALLGSATTRIIYDLEHFQRTGRPVFAATLARETHASDPFPTGGLKIQISFAYSDGFGREIQKKIQAEPGPVPKRDPATGHIITVNGQPEMTPNDVSPRWVGSGWTVFNNKGKPVRQYEPFFTDTHRFEFDVRIGVSPVLFYDPVERVVATLYPNHTWEKVVFDPWRQETWDVNDTVLVADPKHDPDVGDFFRRLPDTDYLPTWHAQRQGGALGPQEQDAARKAAIHADTPTIAHFDSLGRTFLTVAHNKFKRSDTPPADPPTEEFYHTGVLFDIEGNQREVIDAKDRVVMRYDYGILGNRIHQASMEAGERWTLSDVAGKPLYAWDSRDHQFRTVYDPLRRPTESYLREGAGPDLLIERTIYGETWPNPEANNLRAQVVQLFDQAGVVTSDDYDFKGNLLRSQRQLAREYKTTLDWSTDMPLEGLTYTSRTRYDALNRPIQLTAPHSDYLGTKINVIQPGYNEANLLEQVHVWLNQSTEPPDRLDPATATLQAVTDIDYDAKGQRTLIEYGNGVRTTYEYDPLTCRLVHLLTRRDAIAFPDDCPEPPPADWPGCQVQNLHYAYDPVGNITYIRDDAQQTIYFRNKRVEPSAKYTYDAIYRLIEATGREHLGQTGGQANAPTAPDAFNGFHTRLEHPGDGKAMGMYFERYLYDAVGNILAMQHRGSDPAHQGWARTYTYNETSQLEASKVNNRLSSTTIDGTIETYRYDGSAGVHGNITAMPHLPLMQWDYRDQLQATAQQVVNNGGTPETTWYVYDASGQRTRKVTEHQAAAGQTPTRMKERIYLGGFEIYREYENDGETVKLQRETLHIMDDQQRIALVETRTQGNDDSPAELIRYQFSNHLGSASLELDDQAQIISYEEYFPYGSSCYQAVRSQTQTPKRYRYIGKERDEESGFYYHGARYFASWLGRWTSPDPLNIYDGSNLYQYGRSNPVAFIDRNGRQSSLPKEATNEYGERQAYRVREPVSVELYSHSGMYRAYEDVTKVPPGKPISEGLTDVGGYRLAFLRVFYPGKFIIDSPYYLDERLLQAESEVRHFFSTPWHRSLENWQNDPALEKIQLEIYEQETAALWGQPANYGPEKAVEIFKSRGAPAWTNIDPVIIVSATMEIGAIAGRIMKRIAGSTLLAESVDDAARPFEVPPGSPKPYEAPRTFRVDPIRPGESELAYGQRVHQELPRGIAEIHPQAQGRFNVAPGLTGEDFAPSSGFNATFGEMKPITGRQAPMLRQAKRWGFDPQTGHFYFYDRELGIVFQGRIQTEKFPSGRFR